MYAYDYSEYETPLVGQGMLSWILSRTTPESKPMVPGRVTTGTLGVFSKAAAQETLEVKLRLVPLQTGYRELSDVVSEDLETQSWANFLRQNPDLVYHHEAQNQASSAAVSPFDQSGIEKVHRILSECSTPIPLPSVGGDEPLLHSPTLSAFTPEAQCEANEQLHLQRLTRSQSDMIRPSSSASLRQPAAAVYAQRRDSIQSGYGSVDEPVEPQPRKRAKVYKAKRPTKNDVNLGRQSVPLRVAASAAASVRTHRPVAPSSAIDSSSAAQPSTTEEPVRPPTPMSCPAESLPRREPRHHQQRSQLHESFLMNSSDAYISPYPASDDRTAAAGGGDASPDEESPYQGLFEPFSMPSSPPILRAPVVGGQSSPILPPLAPEPDSGFVSASLEDLMGDDIVTPSLDECQKAAGDQQHVQCPPPSTDVSATNSPHGGASQTDVVSLPEEAPPLSIEKSEKRSVPASAGGGRKDFSSRRSSRRASVAEAAPQGKALAPASKKPQPPDPEQELTNVMLQEGPKLRDKKNRKKFQNEIRLDKAIREGQIPPYCEHCGSIDTPSWRKAFWKDYDGSEQDAQSMIKMDKTIILWMALERDDQDKVVKFRIYKKSLAYKDKDFTSTLFCNREWNAPISLFWE